MPSETPLPSFFGFTSYLTDSSFQGCPCWSLSSLNSGFQNLSYIQLPAQPLHPGVQLSLRSHEVSQWVHMTASTFRLWWLWVGSTPYVRTFLCFSFLLLMTEAAIKLIVCRFLRFNLLRFSPSPSLGLWTLFFLYSLLRIPGSDSDITYPWDGGAWWAAVYGVAQSWTRLKRLSSSNRKDT